MSDVKVAVLGGDAREAYIAGRLRTEGYDVALYGLSPDGDSSVRLATSAEGAVRDARWIVCPSPGLGEGDRVYAPASPTAIVLDRKLMEDSAAAKGGLVLGRATPGVLTAAAELGVSVFEMKDDRSLAASNARSVAEALVAILVHKTVRILPELRILVVGYGATGAALTRALLGLSCRVRVAARRPEPREEVARLGGDPVEFADRVDAMAESDIVVNTVPYVEAVPAAAYGVLGSAIVVDIASPPGGMDHDAAKATGVDVTWARGLAGARAPHSAGDAQLGFILRSMAGEVARSGVPEVVVTGGRLNGAVVEGG